MRPTETSAFLLVAAAAALGAAAVLLAASAVGAADIDAPDLTVGYPAEGAFINGTLSVGGGAAQFVVTVLIEDNGTRPDPSTVSVEMWSHDSAGPVDAVSAATSVTSPTTLRSLIEYQLGDGRYTMRVRASDFAGNSAYLERNFTVDVTPPSLEVFAPPFVSLPTATVRIDARDGVSGPSVPVFLSYKDACSYVWLTKPFEVTRLPGRIVGEASMPLCIGGNNQFTVVVRDAAGNAASASQRKVAYDISPPLFSEFTPRPFERLDGTRVQLSAQAADDATGVNASSMEVQVSQDGGLTWSPWQAARAAADGLTVKATADVVLKDGATVGVRWRASDLAGHGPAASAVQFFYVNGPPFVVAFEPAEGAVIPEFAAVRLWAEFADPDADAVLATFRSDLDGPLGRADGKRVQLSVGVHNLTLEGYDGHGHWVNYTYEVEVRVRAPPDIRPLLFTGVLAGVMLWAAYAVWTRERERSERAAAAPKA